MFKELFIDPGEVLESLPSQILTAQVVLLGFQNDRLSGKKSEQSKGEKKPKDNTADAKRG
jgi:hypothetical protein